MEEFINSINKINISNVASRKILSNETKKLLLKYQHEPTIKLINIVVDKYVALISSETGTGKSYEASAICKELKKRPLLICPKTLMVGWKRIFDYFGIEPFDIVNYETIRNAKMYTNEHYTQRDNSTYISHNKNRRGNPDGYYYNWNLPRDTIIIFDEVHRCKEPSTANGRLLLSTRQLKELKIPVILLSATICERFEDMRIPFILFEFIPSTRNYSEYIKLVCKKYKHLEPKKADYPDNKSYAIALENSRMLVIFNEIINFTSRIRIKNLGDMFPVNQWGAHDFHIKKFYQISDNYKCIHKLIQKMKKNKSPSDHILPKIQKLKQKIELLKIPIFVDQARSYLDEGKSVIIFVNYIATLDTISDLLSIKCKIQGNQNMEQRQTSIDLFQSNIERIIICQIRAGGVGISLHDIHGNHPRVSLINYPDSASDLIQALGRAPRAGAKSAVIQKIICTANVEYEKNIMENINKKLANLSAINDGDLDQYKYIVE